MPRQYQAFISYRHAELDSRVAAEVQRSLERFHIPVAVRKETGKKSLAPIFRDKEELPVTAELSEDIGNALANAEHLIVICSPRLKESSWCQREIATFLQTHPVHDVLTVLAEGEPYDVIPEVLLKRPQQVTLEDGTVQEVLVDAEPLSCDFRSAKRSDHRSEVTRLAAAMLRVPYDSLARRQQRYRRRLATVAAIAASAIIAYGTWSLITIRSDYQQTLRSQSKTLARDAMELYEQGNRMEAIELSLAALPGEGGKRPVVAEAELALQEASRAYLPREEMGGYLRTDHADYNAARSFALGEEIFGMAVSPDGGVVAAYSLSGKVMAWDATDGRVLYERKADDTIAGIEPIDNERLLAVVDDTISCMSLDDGTPLWEERVDDEGRIVQIGTSSQVESDGEESGPGITTFLWDVQLDRQSGNLMVYGDSGAFVLDPADGTLLRTIVYEDASAAGERATFSTVDFATGGGYGAVAWDQDLPDEMKNILFCNQARGSCVLSEDAFQEVTCIQPISDSRVMVSAAVPGGKLAGTQYWYSGTWRSSVTEPYDQLVCCLDPETGKTLWSQTLSLRQPYIDISMFEISLADRGTGSREVVVWCGSNVCAWLDATSGDVLGTIETSAPFVSSWVGEEQTDSATGEPVSAVEGCLSGGEFAICLLEKNYSLSQTCYALDPKAAVSTEAGEFVAAGETVTLYTRGQCDDSWRLLTSDYYDADDVYPTDQGVFALDLYGTTHEDAPTAALYNPESAREVWSVAIDSAGSTYDYTFLGYARGAGCFALWYSASGEEAVVLINATDGTVTRHPIADFLEQGSDFYLGLDAVLAGDRVLFSGSTDLRNWVCSLDLNSLTALFYDIDASAWKYGASTEGDWVLIGTDLAEEAAGEDAYRCIALNTGTGERWEVPDAVVGGYPSLGQWRLHALWAEDGSLYAKTPHAIVGYAPGGTQRFSSDTTGCDVLGMDCTDGRLRIFMLREGRFYLRVLDAKSGRQIGEWLSNLESNEQGVSSASFVDLATTSSDEQGRFVLALDDGRCVIMDEEGGAYQTVDDCLGYDATSDVFLVGSGRDGGIGAFDRYSTDELISFGLEKLGDSRMSDERRQEFGL